ncbi:MAG: radical SAM protein, partial [Candidatus Omnitrophica bacterium]|nr:radical SAM protein [Candidatus Omnitrophota bacterium]
MKDFPKLLISDAKGRVYDVPGLAATGMKSGAYYRLKVEDLVPLHSDSELFMLPDRSPVGYDPVTGRFKVISGDTLTNGPCSAVAAFMAPGYTSTYSASFSENDKASRLPLFSYSSAAFYKGRFYASGVRVDSEKRQELSGMDSDLIKKNVARFRKLFPSNRLMRHLEKCALIYGCPAGRNFFLQRYECPLPTSPVCNSRCLGCISHQPEGRVPVTQPRITFVPTPEEIAETALWHMKNVKDPVVSFGQGCEGEPLMVGEVLVKAVKLIRKATAKGIVNLNTNASRPDIIRELFDSGLDSIRVSMNSVREEFYSAYYKPKGYSFADVLSSIGNAKRVKGFVSVNYLVMPGFTDSAPEGKALMAFIARHKIDMIQWRNLNYDPLAYFRDLGAEEPEESIGIKELISNVYSRYPRLMKGYFNPSRRRMARHRLRRRAFPPRSA